MKWIKKLSIYVLVMCVISLFLTFIGMSSSELTTQALFLDRLFSINLLCFIITGIAFIDNFGTFNVFKYSLRHFRVTVSKKYKVQLQCTDESLKSDKDIKTYLQKKYLYAERRRSSLHVYFTFNAIVLATFLVVTLIFV